MKNNHLVVVDWLLGFLITPAILIIIIIKYPFKKYIISKRSGTLIIKFLGAGNYIAFKDYVNNEVEILTAISNRNAINYFLRPKKIFYIDDRSYINLIFSVIKNSLILLFNSYDVVINLEPESNFAKLMSVVIRSNKILGLTNKNRSYLDFLLYDRYLVSPVMLTKIKIIDLLYDGLYSTNEHIDASIIDSQNRFIEQGFFYNKKILNIVIAPTGSDTNHLRRLAADKWHFIFKTISNKYPSCTFNLVFQNKNDWQYNSIVGELSKYKNVNIKIGNYDDYINIIKIADLVICIDSQTLHISSVLNKPVVCFFGPTSPYEVGYTKNVFPISKSVICSPCMHKYFVAPCGNLLYCMNFTDEELSFINKIT